MELPHYRPFHSIYIKFLIMKKTSIQIFVWIVAVTVLMFESNAALAQAKKRTAKRNTTPPTQQPANNAANPYLQNNNSNTNSNNPYLSGNPNNAPAANSNTNANANTPKPQNGCREYVNMPSSSEGGLFDTVKVSLRPDDPTRNYEMVRDKTPLAYDFIREDDAVFKERVWSEIDIREKMNQVFGYASNEDNGNQRLISIIVQAVMNGDVTAFDANDDRFTTPLSKADFMKTFGGGIDTIQRRNIDGQPTGVCEIRQRQIVADSIYKFRIKEDYIFDKEASRLVRRIIGIAPMMKRYLSDGTTVGNDLYPLFWVYYPDIRATFAKVQVYNPKNNGARMSWDDLFESHMYSSYIVKTTMDNFKNQYFKDYIKDPLFRLLAGEKVKEKIFNYEQDLWAY
ncbi:MAG: gliding motility protein GldN [Hydrotalea sp. AMD]|nr:MAG: gliding motility protein GldN [Hydrotalea sp. AMD]